MKQNWPFSSADFFTGLNGDATSFFDDADVCEWHRGIARYGVWLIFIDDPSWLAQCALATNHLARYLHPDNLRAPHISLLACGLVDDSFFSQKLLSRQIESLQEAALPSFFLHFYGLRSFSTGPFIEVRDHGKNLATIRSLLQQISPEDSPSCYLPHITLGLYQGSYPASEIVDHCQMLPQLAADPLAVTELCFCTYRTNTIFGSLHVEFRLKLSPL